MNYLDKMCRGLIVSYLLIVIIRFFLKCITIYGIIFRWDIEVLEMILFHSSMQEVYNIENTNAKCPLFTN